MHAQCDSGWNEYVLLEALIGYQKDNKAISILDQQITEQGRPATCKTTAGWQICCQWKDGSTTWETLSELKESHPVQTAEFAVV